MRLPVRREAEPSPAEPSAPQTRVFRARRRPAAPSETFRPSPVVPEEDLHSDHAPFLFLPEERRNAGSLMYYQALGGATSEEDDSDADQQSSHLSSASDLSPQTLQSVARLKKFSLVDRYSRALDETLITRQRSSERAREDLRAAEDARRVAEEALRASEEARQKAAEAPTSETTQKAAEGLRSAEVERGREDHVRSESELHAVSYARRVLLGKGFSGFRNDRDDMSTLYERVSNEVRARIGSPLRRVEESVHGALREASVWRKETAMRLALRAWRKETRRLMGIALRAWRKETADSHRDVGGVCGRMGGLMERGPLRRWMQRAVLVAWKANVEKAREIALY